MFPYNSLTITAKALRRVGLLFKCFITRDHNILVKAFNTYVRPVLEYASSIWSPTQIGLINRLETVQRRFTKRLPGIGHLTYRERLSALNLESLEIRRLRLDLLLTYKILFGMADIDSHKLFCLRANIKPTRGHGFKLVQVQFETQRRRSFFCQRVVNVWNSLPVSIVNFSSFNSFKRSLQNVNWSIFTRV